MVVPVHLRTHARRDHVGHRVAKLMYISFPQVLIVIDAFVKGARPTRAARSVENSDGPVLCMVVAIIHP